MEESLRSKEALLSVVFFAELILYCKPNLFGMTLFRDLPETVLRDIHVFWQSSVDYLEMKYQGHLRIGS